MPRSRPGILRLPAPSSRCFGCFIRKLRPLYALAVLAVAVGLIGANYHFLSDVIAGGFVGTSTGWMTVALWRARGRAPATG